MLFDLCYCYIIAAVFTLCRLKLCCWGLSIILWSSKLLCLFLRLPTDSVVSAYCLWIGPEHVSLYYTCNLGSDNTCFLVAINKPIRLSCLVFKINEYVCIESVCVHERHLCHWLVCVPVSGLIWCPGWRSRALTSLCSVPAVQ